MKYSLNKTTMMGSHLLKDFLAKGFLIESWKKLGGAASLYDEGGNADIKIEDIDYLHGKIEIYA
ncbi:hypothetical protein H8S90_06340 [Olivibacter sp. SDN3]|uniref:hypothetical protein n=1 Tax=Olivibacter sp. SDN3 TaxID=2764720 RepID=UPI001650EACE|nr:hypothetical protein [Olivibacter sp. SDN3]QNL51199.1 hypothetical protein H8S90_06340 [Olivibacter sp. SDN3]